MYSSLLFASFFACSQSFNKEGNEVNVDTATEPSGDPSQPEANSADEDNDGDGFSENQGDCNDNNPELNPEDLDNDGHSTCDGDCNDVNDSIYPGADEIFYNDTDENCDPSDEYDADGDGFDSAAETNNGQDCDDTNDKINPGVSEDPSDGVDTDCDGVGDARFQLGYVDADCIDCAGPSGIATDSAGQVHVVYEDTGLLWYRYLQNEFGNWSPYDTIDTDNSRTVAYESDDRYGLDVRVDPADNVQVAYISTGLSDTSLHYLFRNSDGAWSAESIVDGYDPSEDLLDTSVGYFVEMEIENNAPYRPVFAYYNETQGLPYLFDFTDQIIDFVAGGGDGVRLPLDYFSENLTALNELTSPDAYSGTHVSLAKDSSDNTHIVYYNHNTALFGSEESQYNRIPKLSTSTFTENAASILNNPVAFATSFATGDVCWPGRSVMEKAKHNTLAIHGSQVCIAYKDIDDGNLYFGCKSTGNTCDGWQIEPVPVDSTGNVGDYATLEFNSQGQPYIAYQNSTLKELKVATKESGAWEVITVDDSADVGKFADMTIDNSDVVHLSYLSFESGKGKLKYAWGKQSHLDRSTRDSPIKQRPRLRPYLLFPYVLY